jgi:bifunctional DNA-binding transcriptional regulator/antitoxin component of YhaV-PrlF toxin-antitoxin module
VAEFTSKVSISRPRSPSLRTTIPEGVAKLIGLKAGDDLSWKVNIKGGKVEIILSKQS